MPPLSSSRYRLRRHIANSKRRHWPNTVFFFFGAPKRVAQHRVFPNTSTPAGAQIVNRLAGSDLVVKAVKGLMFRGGIATSSRSDATSWAKQGSAGASIGMVMV